MCIYVRMSLRMHACMVVCMDGGREGWMDVCISVYSFLLTYIVHPGPGIDGCILGFVGLCGWVRVLVCSGPFPRILWALGAMLGKDRRRSLVAVILTPIFVVVLLGIFFFPFRLTWALSSDDSLLVVMPAPWQPEIQISAGSPWRSMDYVTAAVLLP